MPLQHTAVSSSHIASVAHDAEANVLEVAFNDGSVYQYEGVSAMEHAELMAAKSHGSHFLNYIKRRISGRRVDR